MITEPTTLATDYILAGLTAWLGWRLHHHARRTAMPPVRLWAAAFGATALGSFAGGTYHGFVQILPAAASALTWKIATVAVGVAASLLLSAVLIAAFPIRVRGLLLGIVWLQFAAYLVWMIGHDDFLYVIVEYGSAMVAIVLVLLFIRAPHLQPARRWIIAGIGATLAAAGIQQSGFDLHRHFNHNDLQHVVQMGGVWLLYRGGLHLKSTS
jgi:hypothetical protein